MTIISQVPSIGSHPCIFEDRQLVFSKLFDWSSGLLIAMGTLMNDARQQRNIT